MIIQENLKLMFKDFIVGYNNPDESDNRKVPNGTCAYELRVFAACYDFYLYRQFRISPSYSS